MNLIEFGLVWWINCTQLPCNIAKHLHKIPHSKINSTLHQWMKRSKIHHLGCTESSVSFFVWKKNTLPTTGVTNNIPPVHVNKFCLWMPKPPSRKWPISQSKKLVWRHCWQLPGQTSSQTIQDFWFPWCPPFLLDVFHQQVCHTVDGWNPKQPPGMYETLWINYLSTGAGFLPSTGMSYDWVFDIFLKWCKLWDGN